MLGNIWKCAVDYTPRYYLPRPWKFFQDAFRGVKWAWQRMVRGYADADTWNLCDWMIEVLAPMFEDFAKNHYGYPLKEGDEYTDEQWTQFLKDIATHLRNASEDQTVVLNEYEKELDELSDITAKKVTEYVDEKGCKHHVFPEQTPEEKALYKKYFQREREIYEWRLKEVQTALQMIGEDFFNLWD